jgi:heat shock protein HslJ
VAAHDRSAAGARRFVRRVLGIGALLTVFCVTAAACSSSSGTSGSSGGSDAGSRSGVAALRENTWNLTQYREAGRMTNAAGLTASWLRFGAAGALQGDTGCNGFGGHYEVDGSSITLDLGPITAKACSGAVGRQDRAIVDGFPKVARLLVSGGSVTFSDRDDRALFLYHAADTGIEGTKWSVTGVNNGKQAVVSGATTAKLTAEFGTDGRFTGSGGCNRLGGPYTTSGSDAIAIGPVTSTKQACAADVMTTESEYVAALGQAATYEIAGDRLTVRDAAGATQFTATRTT